MKALSFLQRVQDSRQKVLQLGETAAGTERMRNAPDLMRRGFIDAGTSEFFLF